MPRGHVAALTASLTYNRRSRNNGGAVDDHLILDRYRPLAELGSGGHGTVVRAFDTRMARRVAIKRLPLPTDRAGRPLARAGLAEARTAALLNHPAIVIVHEWDSDDEYAYIVMEDIDGISLADALDETGEPLDTDEVAAVLESIAAALEFAHHNGVLHLDLKPANIMVTRDGRVKVADFGVSALTGAGGTAHGTAGTIGYMPPEQIRHQPLDERTDVWALGALTYELLTNANPFDSDTTEGSLFKIEVAEIPAPSEFEPSLGPDIDDVVLGALAPDPDERYHSVRQFAFVAVPAIGDPAAGRESLAARADWLSGEATDDEDLSRAEGLWDRLTPYAGAVRRIGGGAACAWLTWAAVAALALEDTAAIAVTLMVALAAVLAPGLGLALALGALAAGVWVVLGWASGLGTGVVAAVFWAVRGRLGRGDALLPFVAPALGLVRAAPLLPLAAGLAFRPLPAAFSAATGAFVLTAASALSGAGAPFLGVRLEALLDPWAADTAWRAGGVSLEPAMLAVPLVWALAAAVVSIGASRQTRLSASVGIAGGAAVLVAGYAGWATLSARTVPLASAMPDVAAGVMLAAIAVSLGPPLREPPA